MTPSFNLPPGASRSDYDRELPLCQNCFEEHDGQFECCPDCRAEAKREAKEFASVDTRIDARTAEKPKAMITVRTEAGAYARNSLLFP